MDQDDDPEKSPQKDTITTPTRPTIRKIAT